MRAEREKILQLLEDTAVRTECLDCIRPLAKAAGELAVLEEEGMLPSYTREQKNEMESLAGKIAAACGQETFAWRFPGLLRRLVFLALLGNLPERLPDDAGQAKTACRSAAERIRAVRRFLPVYERVLAGCPAEIRTEEENFYKYQEGILSERFMLSLKVYKAVLNGEQTRRRRQLLEQTEALLRQLPDQETLQRDDDRIRISREEIKKSLEIYEQDGETPVGDGSITRKENAYDFHTGAFTTEKTERTAAEDC